MAQVYKLDGVTLTNRIRLNNDQVQGVVGLPGAAWYGEVRSAGIVIDDPLGELDLELNSIHTFTMDETASVGSERQFLGWLVAKNISRGPYTTGAGCQYDCEIYDQNWIFHFQVARASSAVRPAETDVQRVQWLITSALMSGTPIADNGRFSTASPANLPGNNFVPEYPEQILEPTAGNSGKQFYAYWDNAADETSLHYDLVNTGPACTLSISNVEADLDSTTFWPFIDATLEADARGIVNGMLFGYSGGRYVYVDNPGLFGPNEFSPVNFRRDEVYRTDAVGLTSTANTLAARYLASRAAEQDTITCAIKVPASQVGLIQPGMIINAKFSHLRNYKSGDDTYIKYRDLVPSKGRRDWYDVHLTLTNAVPIFPSGGDGTEGPAEPVVPGILHKYGNNVPGTGGTRNWSSAPDDQGNPAFTATAGNILLLAVGARNGHSLATPVTSTPGGETWDILPNGHSGGGGFTDSVAWYMIEAVGGETGWDPNLFASDGGVWFVYELVGVDPAAVITALDNGTGTLEQSDIAAPAGDPAFIAMAAVASGDTAVSNTPGSGWTEDIEDTPSGNFHPHFTSIHKITNAASATETPNSTLGSSRDWWALSVVLEGGGDTATPPPANIHVIHEVVTMVGDSGTTRFPFVPGSLKVFVDLTDQTLAVIDQDPAAGTFQLAFDPTPTEQVVVDYQVAAATD